jgi:basic amino acid/polyamine antiporter, APA family
VVAITSALLVYQLGQPRIWMSMSRDGLLPKKFSQIHPKYRTPGFSTIITGLLVGIPALFLNMTFVTDLTSVGTFFAFILVCGGILVLDPVGQATNAKFKVPYVNGKFIMPSLLLLTIGAVFYYNQTAITEWSNLGIAGLLEHKLLTIIFWLVWISLAVLSFQRNWSLLPQFGILCNLYLMTELGGSNWLTFVAWLAIGLAIYFMYGYRNSKLSK